MAHIEAAVNTFGAYLLRTNPKKEKRHLVPGKNKVLGKRQKAVYVDKSPKVYTQLAREGVVLTQDSDNI